MQSSRYCPHSSIPKDILCRDSFHWWVEVHSQSFWLEVEHWFLQFECSSYLWRAIFLELTARPTHIINLSESSVPNPYLFQLPYFHCSNLHNFGSHSFGYFHCWFNQMYHTPYFPKMHPNFEDPYRRHWHSSVFILLKKQLPMRFPDQIVRWPGEFVRWEVNQ